MPAVWLQLAGAATVSHWMLLGFAMRAGAHFERFWPVWTPAPYYEQAFAMIAGWTSARDPVLPTYDPLP
jgi:hypothetical protein